MVAIWGNGRAGTTILHDENYNDTKMIKTYLKSCQEVCSWNMIMQIVIIMIFLFSGYCYLAAVLKFYFLKILYWTLFWFLMSTINWGCDMLCSYTCYAHTHYHLQYRPCSICQGDVAWVDLFEQTVSFVMPCKSSGLQSHCSKTNISILLFSSVLIFL